MFQNFSKFLEKNTYNVKSERFHITLGETEEIDEVENIKKEVDASIQNNILSQAFIEFFGGLEWSVSIVNLSKFPAKIAKQIKI